MMQLNPRTKSHIRVSPACVKTLRTLSAKPDESNFKPIRPFSWDVPIITDVAEVKPTVTGMDIKSTKTPVEVNDHTDYFYGHLYCTVHNVNNFKSRNLVKELITEMKYTHEKLDTSR